MKPVFIDEVIQPVGGAPDAVYDLTNGAGVFASGVKMTLKNPVTQKGTPHSAAVMNMLFDFDNIAGMPGNFRSIVFNADGGTVETIADSASKVTQAVRTTTFPSGTNTIMQDVTVYNNDGTTVMRHTKTTSTFNADGTITEVIA